MFAWIFNPHIETKGEVVYETSGKRKIQTDRPTSSGWKVIKRTPSQRFQILLVGRLAGWFLQNTEFAVRLQASLLDFLKLVLAIYPHLGGQDFRALAFDGQAIALNHAILDQQPGW